MSETIMAQVPAGARPMAVPEGRRLKHLDGLRGLAILLVVAFHTFAHWPTVMPYGSRYADLPFTHYGWLGVELFFMISGFVICLTLDRCNTLTGFLARRWLRLFPAMFFISMSIYLSSGLLSERPAGVQTPSLWDLLSGLLFIEPKWLSLVLRHNTGPLEMAFWSLFVEVKFYVFFGALYFSFGRRSAHGGLTFAFALSLLVLVLSHFWPSTLSERLSSFLNDDLSFQYFGWFLIGTLAYELAMRRASALLAPAILAASLATAVHSSLGRHDLTLMVSLLLISVFLTSMYSATLRRALSTRPLLIFGHASYPLYLFHENFIISTTLTLSARTKYVPDSVLALSSIAGGVGIALLIAQYIEPTSRRVIYRTVLALQSITMAGGRTT